MYIPTPADKTSQKKEYSHRSLISIIHTSLPGVRHETDSLLFGDEYCAWLRIQRAGRRSTTSSTYTWGYQLGAMQAIPLNQGNIDGAQPEMY